MTKRKLKKLAEWFNGKKINIEFVSETIPDYFCYIPHTDTIYISNLYQSLSEKKQLIYLLHEIGHSNTISSKKSLYVSDYSAEYDANKWVLNRLKTLKRDDLILEYIKYLKHMSQLKSDDDVTIQYKLAAKDLLNNWRKKK